MIIQNGNNKQIEEDIVTTKGENLGEQLRELNQLKNEGIITYEEFEIKKKELLNI